MIRPDNILQKAGGSDQSAADMYLFQMESEKSGLHLFVQIDDPGGIVQEQQARFCKSEVFAQTIKQTDIVGLFNLSDGKADCGL